MNIARLALYILTRVSICAALIWRYLLTVKGFVLRFCCLLLQAADGYLRDSVRMLSTFLHVACNSDIR